MSDMDPRETISFIGDIFGQGDLVAEILSGRMPANDLLPLVAGMMDTMVVSLAGPAIQAQEWTGFDPTVRPLVGIMTIPNGKIKITLEAIE